MKICKFILSFLFGRKYFNIIILVMNMRKGSEIIKIAGIVLPVLSVSFCMGVEPVEKKTTYTNRLQYEKSPYLLQHADNPVDWYPWGEEAFARAEKEDKPVFLSIGYSTCHWCHVMEHESFEDPEVAALMNETFISIKVDREERPDIDGVYMQTAQMLTGRGGWPLTIIMTPDKKPFFAATYIPKTGRLGSAGMMELIPNIKEIWETRREEADSSAENIAKEISTRSKTSAGTEIDETVLDKGFQQLAQRFDSDFGGFSLSPKFPAPHNLLFLMRYWKKYSDQQAFAMADKTLTAMRLGGMYDHIGGGFHRYSTDRTWTTPHFEKMLYDQAMLIHAYTEGYQIFKNPLYENSVREIVKYVLRDLRSPEGAFFSAEDADSEGEEGKFYLWSYDELQKVLSERELETFSQYYSYDEEGNFRDEATGLKLGVNILFLSGDDIPGGEIPKELEKIKAKLFAAREKRVRPLRDEKILTDWNGLMIGALAKAARVFGEEEWLKTASEAADFLLESLFSEKEGLLHRYKDNESGIPAHLDDYAFLLWGLIELYEAGFNPEYLKTAVTLGEELEEKFWDEEEYGFFFTPDNGEKLLFREKSVYDGALPSGNSAAAYALARLSRISGKTEYEVMAEKIGMAFSSDFSSHPVTAPFLLSAFTFLFAPAQEVILTAPGSIPPKEFIEVLNEGYHPFAVRIFLGGGEQDDVLRSLLPFLENYSLLNNLPTVYVCTGGVCDLPTNDPEMMQSLLN